MRRREVAGSSVLRHVVDLLRGVLARPPTMEAAAARPGVSVSVVQARRYGQLDESSHPTRWCHNYGWLCWAVLTLAQITTFFGTSSAVAFVVEPMMVDLALSRSLLSLSYGIATGFGAAAQIPIGRLVDRFGGRASVALCSAAYYVSLAAMAVPRDWFVLTLAFGAMRTLGFGGLALAGNTCLQQWFVKRRGLATGLSESVNTLVGFGLLSQLYSMAVLEYGWRVSYLLVGGVLLLVFPPMAAMFLRSKPEDIGLAPDGEPPEERTATGTLGGQSPSSKSELSGWTLREAARTPALWVLLAANALMFGIGAGVFFHLVSIVDELQLPLELLPSCFFLPWAMARAVSLVLAGYLLDKTHPRFVLFGGFVLGGATFVVLGWPGTTLTPARAVAISTMWGFSMGFGKATFGVCPAQFFGRRHLGSISGVLQTTNVASTAVGPLVVGMSHDALGSYSPIILVIACVYVTIGSVGGLLLQRPRRRAMRTVDGDGAGAGVAMEGAASGVSAMQEIAHTAAATPTEHAECEAASVPASAVNST